LKAEYTKNFLEAQDLREKIESLSRLSHEREQKMDFLKFQITEIDNFNPVLGEDTDISTRFERARAATKLHTFAEKAEGALYGEDRSVHAILKELQQEGETLSRVDPKLKNGVENLKEAAILVEDASFGFRDYLKTESVDPEELDRIEDRLSDLKKLQKKYGSSVENILQYRDKARQEFENLEKSDESIKEFQDQLKKTEAKIKELAGQLHQKRIKAATKLSSGVNQQLKDLNMKGTEFSVQVTLLPEPGLHGADEVLFLIRGAQKDEPRPVSKIASGGELSRLMLALKNVVASGDLHMTYLFDEVDAGVSGLTAEKVGRKLKAIGSYHQVICITHLPQVAAFADAHFLITKDVVKGQVRSEVKELSQRDRVQELGRMISGEKITASSLAHAKEMIKQFQDLPPGT
jgi:DNA repair protein RecN (Recombination protein N)